LEVLLNISEILVNKGDSVSYIADVTYNSSRHAFKIIDYHKYVVRISISKSK